MRHEAHLIPCSLLSLTNIYLNLSTKKKESKRDLLLNQAFLIIQNQVQSKVARILDFHNRDLVKNNIFVQFVATDLDNLGAPHGDMIFIYASGEFFVDEKDGLRKHCFSQSIQTDMKDEKYITDMNVLCYVNILHNIINSAEQRKHL